MTFMAVDASDAMTRATKREKECSEIVMLREQLLGS
jgi:hypothetical protein